MIYDVIHILFLILFIWLSINVAYLFIFSLAGKFSRKQNHQSRTNRKRIAVLITSHREDAVIVNTVKSAVEHNYPVDKFDVFLAADHLQQTTIQALRQLRVHISEVNFPIGSKARSLNFLLNKIDHNQYDIALVLDGDNIMQTGLLDKVNDVFQNGFKAVQAHRTAKNINTQVAKLDGISEEINNHLFRKAQRVFGFSSSLIGSGMAFEFDTLKNIYNKPGILDNPACDREVDFETMKRGITIEYIEDAEVYDEKVSGKKVFENQRRRWMESQIIHLRLFMTQSGKNKTKDYWNKLFINLIPPRILFVALFAIICVVCILQLVTRTDITGISIRWWAMVFALYVASMLIAIPSRFLNASTLSAFLYLPSIIFTYLRAAFTMKSNRKEFIHTPKTFTGRSETTKNHE